MPQAVLNRVCFFSAHVQCLADRNRDLLSPCVSAGGGLLFSCYGFWFLSGLLRAENGSLSIHMHFFFWTLGRAWGVSGGTHGARCERETVLDGTDSDWDWQGPFSPPPTQPKGSHLQSVNTSKICLCAPKQSLRTSRLLLMS